MVEANEQHCRTIKVIELLVEGRKNWLKGRRDLGWAQINAAIVEIENRKVLYDVVQNVDEEEIRKAGRIV